MKDAARGCGVPWTIGELRSLGRIVGEKHFGFTLGHMNPCTELWMKLY